MNGLKNKVQLIGNTGKAPEIVTFENGNKLARVSLATNDYYVNAKGERVRDTQWHQLVAWGKRADLFEKYVKKGDTIAVEGKLINRSFVTKSGEKRSSVEIELRELLLLGGKSHNGERE